MKKRLPNGKPRCQTRILRNGYWTNTQCRRIARFICGRLCTPCCAQHAKEYAEAWRKPIEEVPPMQP